MSSFTCTNCGHDHDIFCLDGTVGISETPPFSMLMDFFFTGARKKCEQLGVKLLGDIPLHSRICYDADAGKPTVVADPDGPQARAFMKILADLATELGIA